MFFEVLGMLLAVGLRSLGVHAEDMAVCRWRSFWRYSLLLWPGPSMTWTMSALLAMFWPLMPPKISKEELAARVRAFVLREGRWPRRRNVVPMTAALEEENLLARQWTAWRKSGAPAAVELEAELSAGLAGAVVLEPRLAALRDEVRAFVVQHGRWPRRQDASVLGVPQHAAEDALAQRWQRWLASGAAAALQLQEELEAELVDEGDLEQLLRTFVATHHRLPRRGHGASAEDSLQRRMERARCRDEPAVQSLCAELEAEAQASGQTLWAEGSRAGLVAFLAQHGWAELVGLCSTLQSGDVQRSQGRLSDFKAACLDVVLDVQRGHLRASEVGIDGAPQIDASWIRRVFASLCF